MPPVFEAKQADLYFNVAGEEKPRKQTVSYLTEESSGENIVKFGQLIAQLSPDTLSSVVVIDKQRYVV